MQPLTPRFMRYASATVALDDAKAGEQSQNEQDESKTDTLTLERKLDPVKAAMEKARDLLIRNDYKGAFDLLREMRDNRTIEGSKITLSPRHMEVIEDQMRELVIHKLCPDDLDLQKKMFTTLNLSPAPSAPAPAIAFAPQPAMAIGMAPPAPSGPGMAA